jgi:hypothetical protein
MKKEFFIYLQSWLLFSSLRSLHALFQRSMSPYGKIIRWLSGYTFSSYPFHQILRLFLPSLTVIPTTNNFFPIRTLSRQPAETTWWRDRMTAPLACRREGP